MAELKDYQRVLVDNIIEDINESVMTLGDNAREYICDKLESRIEAYDNERREAIVFAFCQGAPRIIRELV